MWYQDMTSMQDWAQARGTWVQARGTCPGKGYLGSSQGSSKGYLGAKIWSSCKTGLKRGGTWVLLTVSWGASMRSCIICFSADKVAPLAAAGPVRSVLRLHLLHSWESSAALLSTAAVLPTPCPDTKSKLATPLQAYSVSLAEGAAVCSQNSSPALQHSGQQTVYSSLPADMHSISHADIINRSNSTVTTVATLLGPCRRDLRQHNG